MNKLKGWLWTVFTLLSIGIVYVTVVSEGLRQVVPTLGTKLHKLPLPLAHRLAGYSGWHQLDIAYFMAMILLIAVSWLWKAALRTYLGKDDHMVPRGWDADKYRKIVLILAVLLLGADACLFYYGVSQSGWGRKFSFALLLATAAYIGVLIFVSFVAICIEQSSKKED